MHWSILVYGPQCLKQKLIGADAYDYLSKWANDKLPQIPRPSYPWLHYHWDQKQEEPPQIGTIYHGSIKQMRKIKVDIRRKPK